MPIGTPTLRGSGGGTTSATTGSFTPGANDLLLAWVAGRRNTSVPVQPTCSDSTGLTWTGVTNGDISYNPGANPRLRGRLFWARAPGSPAAMTVTGSITDAASTGIIVISISSAQSSFSNIKSTTAASNPSVTMDSSPASTSIVAGFTTAGGTPAQTEPTGFTELTEITANTNLKLAASYDSTSPTAGPHAFTSAQPTIALLVEGLASSGQTISAGLATEADSSFAVTWSKQKTIGLAVESSAALSASPPAEPLTILGASVGSLPVGATELPVVASGQTVAVGQASETDTSFATGRSRARTLLLTTEGDEAPQVKPQRIRSIGLTSDAESAQSVTWAKSRQIGLALETDASQSAIRSKSKGVPQANEGDSALSVTFARSKQTSLALSFEQAQSVRPSKVVVLGIAQSNESVLSLSAPVAVGVTSEADAATSVTAIKLRAISLAIENETSQVIVARRAYAIGEAESVESAQSARPEKSHDAGVVSSGESALPVTISRSKAIGIAEDTSTSLTVRPERRHVIAQAVETGVSQPATRPWTGVTGIAIESSEARVLKALRSRSIALEIEDDTALPVNARKSVAIGIAIDAQSSLVVDHFKTRLIGVAAETSQAIATRPRRIIPIGLVIESEETFPVIRERPQAVELSSAFAIRPHKVRSIGIATDASEALILPSAIHTVSDQIVRVPAEIRRYSVEQEPRTVLVPEREDRKVTV